jgi:hypothetical protein
MTATTPPPPLFPPVIIPSTAYPFTVDETIIPSESILNIMNSVGKTRLPFSSIIGHVHKYDTQNLDPIYALYVIAYDEPVPVSALWLDQVINFSGPFKKRISIGTFGGPVKKRVGWS